MPRLPWPGPLGGFRFQFDRCGDLALSRAGPKPRRTRDGHSWRMRPLFSLPLAGPSLLPAASVVVRGRGGGRNPARPRGPASASRGDGGARGLVDAADPLRLAPRPPPVAGVPPGRPSSRQGEGRPSAAPRALPLGARARAARLSVVLLGRSGSSLRCPRPRRCCRFPFPGRDPRAGPPLRRPAAVVGESSR